MPTYAKDEGAGARDARATEREREGGRKDSLLCEFVTPPSLRSGKGPIRSPST